jgi:hypothetical protein
MERLIFRYTISDSCTYWSTEHIPFEYESKEAAERDIFTNACSTFLNDDLDGWKISPHGHAPEPFCMKMLEIDMEHYYFFSRTPIPNSKRFKIDYTPTFEILTLDEFFAEKEPLFS